MVIVNREARRSIDEEGGYSILKIQRRCSLPSLVFASAPRLHALFSASGGLLLLGLAFLGALLLQRWRFDPTIASTPMLLVIALVALFWGTVPALAMLLVSTIALDYL